MLRRTAMLLVLVLWAAAPAAAQDAVPDDAVVVAGPAAGGHEVVAFAGERGQLCLAFRPAEFGTSSCGPVPARPGEQVKAYRFADDRGLHAGAVAPGVTAVDLRFAQGQPRSVTGPTAAPGRAIPGVRGSEQLRFYLLEGPSRQPWMTRELGADGAVLGAEADGFEAPIVGRPATLQRGAGRRLRVLQRRALAATPLQRDRTITETCLALRPGPSSGGPCVSRDDPLTETIRAQPAASCGASAISALVPSTVRRLELVLGDGRRSRVALTALPARLGVAARGGATIVRGAVAIRRAEAFDARGRRVGVEELWSPPAKPCRPASGSSASTYVLFHRTPVGGADRGPLAFSVRDDGARLCTTLGRFDPRRRDCALPPLDPDFASPLYRVADGRTLVAGVVPAEVAVVDVRVDGTWRRVETTDDVPGYGGQYRGQVRFVVLDLPGAPRVDRVRLRDATGRVLATDVASGVAEPEVVPLRSLRVGGELLRVGRYRLGGEDLPCATPQGAPAEDCLTTLENSVMVTASCRTGRLIAVGEVTAGTTSVTLRGRRGATRARLVTVDGRRLFLGVLPSGRDLRTVVARGRARRTARLELPPAGRQCGYYDVASLDLR